MTQVVAESHQRADPHDGADEIDDEKASLRQLGGANDIGIGGAHESDVAGGDQGQDAVLVEQVVDLILVAILHVRHQAMIHLGVAEKAPLHVAKPGADEGGHDQQRDHRQWQHILIDEHAGQDQQAVAGQKSGRDKAILEHQKGQ